MLKLEEFTQTRIRKWRGVFIVPHAGRCVLELPTRQHYFCLIILVHRRFHLSALIYKDLRYSTRSPDWSLLSPKDKCLL